MKKLSPLWGIVVGLLWTAPLTAVLYLGDQLVNLPFVPFRLFDWMSSILPGGLLTFGIDLMIDTLRFIGGSDAVTNAKLAEQAMAVGLFVGAGVAAAFLFFLLLRRSAIRPSPTAGIVLGIAFGLPLLLIVLLSSRSEVSLLLTIPWLALLFLAWGVGVSWSAQRLLATDAVETAVADTRSVEKIGRRQFLIRLGASTAAVTVVGSGVGVVLARAAEEARRAQGNVAALLGGQTNITSFPNDGAAVVPAPGTRSEYTPIPDHYKVFLKTEPSFIEEADWILPITGMVDNPQMLTLADIRNNYPARDQFVTLSCISGRVGTSLISTTLWTGVSAQVLLADLGIQPGAKYLDITSEDGFHESVDLALIEADERIMFCYDWDGMPLPQDHGFPLRIWIPDRFGMKQPKWITGIEVTDEYRQGYWVERNWDEVAQVKTTSVIDTVAVDDAVAQGGQTVVPVGGIAWAGDRQISKVEVRVDNGDWQEAQLRQPLSETTWVIWRYEWPFSEGEHLFEVRCYEGDGTPQIAETKTQRPDGATGIDSYEI